MLLALALSGGALSAAAMPQSLEGPARVEVHYADLDLRHAADAVERVSHPSLAAVHSAHARAALDSRGNLASIRGRSF